MASHGESLRAKMDAFAQPTLHWGLGSSDTSRKSQNLSVALHLLPLKFTGIHKGSRRDLPGFLVKGSRSVLNGID